MNTKNYNATRSLSYYTLGDAYIFYVHDNRYDQLCKADVETINTYSSIITEIINDGTYSQNDGKWSAYTRVIGVVVDKHKATNRNDVDTITVMFKTDREDYVLKKYAVKSNQVIVKKKREVPPSAVLRTV